MKTTTEWRDPIRVTARKPMGYPNNLSDFKPSPLPLNEDWGNVLMEFEANEFPIERWESVSDFQDWATNNIARYLSDGIYYLRTTSQFSKDVKRRIDPITGRKRVGRPPKRIKRKKGKFQNVVAKIEVEDHVVVRVFLQQGYRKYSPYHRTFYELVKKIEQNRKGGAVGETLESQPPQDRAEFSL